MNSRVERGYNPIIRDINALIGLMEEALPSSDYSATVATVLLNDENYCNIVNYLRSISRWNAAFESLHGEIEQVKLNIIDD